MITLAQLEKRYAELQADYRAAELAWIEKRGGYKYVLGELEGMIAELKVRQAAEAENAPRLQQAIHELENGQG